MEIRELIKGKEIDPQKLIELQAEINKIEAQHRTIFVAGWRPFIGWVCGFALAYNFVIRELFTFTTPDPFGLNDIAPFESVELKIGRASCRERV